MTEKEIEAAARKLLDQHGLQHVGVFFYDPITAAAAHTAWWFEGNKPHVAIAFCSPLMTGFPDEVVEDTVIHEVAHAILGETWWKRLLRKFGLPRHETVWDYHNYRWFKLYRKLGGYCTSIISAMQITGHPKGAYAGILITMLRPKYHSADVSWHRPAR